MYEQLSQEERYQIHAYRQAGFSNIEIGRKLKRNKSTIGREIFRNKGLRGYRPKQAQEFCEERHQNKEKMISFTNEVHDFVVTLLVEKWSPEQISGWLSKKEICNISHQKIYDFVREDRDSGGDLYKNLRQSNKKRRKRYGSKSTTRGQIKDRTPITERPLVVEMKERVGDWEGDTVVGKDHKGFIVTLVDRKSKITLIEKVEDKSERTVTKAVINALRPYKSQTHTITFDNGKEFAGHKEIAKALNAAVYFAKPYASYERGLNENTNGLIRQWAPKKTDFRDLDDDFFDEVQDALNSRPRKTLNYQTPWEIFRSA
jgi:IS30 family transposase